MRWCCTWICKALKLRAHSTWCNNYTKEKGDDGDEVMTQARNHYRCQSPGPKIFGSSLQPPSPWNILNLAAAKWCTVLTRIQVLQQPFNSRTSCKEDQYNEKHMMLRRSIHAELETSTKKLVCHVQGNESFVQLQCHLESCKLVKVFPSVHRWLQVP